MTEIIIETDGKTPVEIPIELGPLDCEYFALCDREATVLRPHPILGLVPTCDRCNDRIEAMQ